MEERCEHCEEASDDCYCNDEPNYDVEGPISDIDNYIYHDEHSEHL